MSSVDQAKPVGRASMTIDKTTMRIAGLAGAAAFLALTLPASAEMQFGGYMGYNQSFNSDVTIDDGHGGHFKLNVPWRGLSFTPNGGAPYYGLRGTYWLDSKPHWGVMLDYTHAKVRADPNAPAGAGTIGDLFSVLEFTDGLNLLTMNGVYRADPIGVFTPYVGAGIGISVPHVEFLEVGRTDKTFRYEFGGLAAQVLAGVQVPLGHNMSAFGEYKLSYAAVDSPLDNSSGPKGNIKTDVWTNHFLLGVAVSWGGP